MAVALLKKYPLKFITSIDLNEFTVYSGTNDTVQIFSGVPTFSVYPVKHIVTFYVKRGFACQFLTFTATNFVGLYDGDGNPLIPNAITSSAGYTPFYAFQNDSVYTIEIYNTVVVAPQTAMVSLTGTKEPNSLDYFSQGILRSDELSSAVVSSYNAFGALTLTFTAFPLSLAQTILASIAEIGISAGTLTVTSSDATVFVSYTQAFTVNNSIAVVLLSQKTTTFTGTVIVSITGLGVSAPINIVAQEWNSFDDSIITAFSAFKAEAMPTVQIVAGLVSSKVQDEFARRDIKAITLGVGEDKEEEETHMIEEEIFVPKQKRQRVTTIY